MTTKMTSIFPRTPDRNLVLIGLPGVGKSTVGALLSKSYGCQCIDTDQLIEQAAGANLQQVLEQRGVTVLRELESEVVSRVQAAGCIIATGGSVVYSDQAMRHLSEIGFILYLCARAATVLERMGDFAGRGIVRLPGQSIHSVIDERLPLYAHYADAVIDVDDLMPNQVVEAWQKISADK